MQFKYKNKTYNLPTTLQQITLGQMMGFEKAYGKQIEEKQKALNPQPDGSVDELDAMLLNIEVACFNLAYFSGIPLAEVKALPLEQVLNVYHSCFKQIYVQQEDTALQLNYLWQGEVWHLEAPQLSYHSQLTFNEFIVAKQTVKQLSELGAGNWTALQHLAVIFLRRKDEAFNEGWMAEGSERFALMEKLPLDMALALGFFLQSSMSLYLNTSRSSQAGAGAKAQA